MRGYRKDIADLLRSGKLDYAIIRVESVIREQLTLTGARAVLGVACAARTSAGCAGCAVLCVPRVLCAEVDLAFVV